MARGGPPLRAEDAKALTLLMSPAADEFTIALDRCGWMIVPQPQFDDRRWFLNYPSDRNRLDSGSQVELRLTLDR